MFYANMNWLNGRLLRVMAGVMVLHLSQFALADESERIYHGLTIEVGAGAPVAKNIRYRYGDLGWRNKEAAQAGVGDSIRSVMTIPEEFVISWKFETGESYEFKVPVRSRIKTDIRGKTILFVMTKVGLEGYVATQLPTFKIHLDRFY